MTDIETLSTEITKLVKAVQVEGVATRTLVSTSRQEFLTRIAINESRLNALEDEAREHFKITARHGELLAALTIRVEEMTKAASSGDITEVLSFFREAQGWLKFNKIIGVFLIALVPVIVTIWMLIRGKS